jgi:magnesium-transporting ATPase (P-type)
MATSEDKKMIIEELKKMKETVLFVDSGNADVSALKSADASISLESAAELSKYNADAILLNDNFYWVPKSVEESKALGDVVIRSFYSLFISDFAIIFLILLSAILTAKPMNILQILFVNLIADSLIGIGLAMDRRHGSALKSSLQFPSKNAFAFAIFMAVYAAVAVFVVANYVPSAYFTSVATAGIVLCAVANALNFSTDSSIFKSRPSNRILLAVTAAIVFLLFITYVPTVNTVFGMLPLQPMHWGLVLMAAVSSILIMEIRKAVAK